MHRYLKFTRAARLVSVALPLLFVSSCGTHETNGAMGTDQNETLSQLEAWRANPRADRFSAAEIASVYTTATKVVNGRTYPDSKASVKFIYTPANAPQKFRAENGDFTQGAEIKGFLNLGFAPSNAFQQRFVSSFEKVSTWKAIAERTSESAAS